MAGKDDEAMPAVPGLPQLGIQEAMMMEVDEPPSELDKIIEMILNAANIGHLTELSRNEIMAFGKARTMCKRHPEVMGVGLELIAEILVLKVSKSRKGRGELIKILNRSISMQEQVAQAQQKPGFFGRRR